MPWHLIFRVVSDLSSPQLSKLELYVKILEIVVENGSLTISEIGAKTGFEFSSLVLATEFLEQQQCLYTVRRGRNFIVQSTPKGLGVLKYFGRNASVIQSKAVLESQDRKERETVTRSG